MKKVATLSFQNAYNYGAVFQVTALQHIIESLGADCDIIDYRCPAIDAQYNFKPLKINSSIFKALRSNLVLLPFINEKKKNFTHWFDSYKKTPIFKREQLYTLNEQYDYFVVGSDQVWNMKCHGHDESYFLDFVTDDTKKIAYAASFGTFNVSESDKSLYIEHLGKFSSISVRESSGVKLVKDLSQRKSITCMDPVMLVGREFWECKADDSYVNLKKDYIFVYQLGHSRLLSDYVNAMKKHTNLKVVYITGHIGNMMHYSLFDINESTSSPEHFLSLLSHAKYVVTNSFHATVLSILFEKKEKTTDYAKIAKALGDIIARGIQVSLVDINKLHI